MKISIVGLGKLGSPMAACFAAKGHQVIGVDLNQEFVDKINQCKAPVFEPRLQEMLDQTEGRLSATTDLKQAVEQTEITFLIVPTPSLPDGSFSMEYVMSAAQPIAEVLKEKDEFHVVVLTSTVMPGATCAELIPQLEKLSGKKCPQDFGVCYSPEFIALGNVVTDYLNPDFVLVGENDTRAGDKLQTVYDTVCENSPRVARMGFANAELTKIALNTFVTTKISYANMLAEICERLPDGNVDDVTSALGLDKRIGKKYLKGSVGYGGPCFPRDNRAIINLTEQLGVNGPLPVATDTINNHQVPRLKQIVQSCLPPGGCVGILGTAYKPHTNFVEKAQGLELAQALIEDGISVVVYDPEALENTEKVLQDGASYAESVSDCAKQSDVLVISSPCAEFQQIAPTDIARNTGRATLIDCWRILDAAQFDAICNYIGIGTSAVQAITVSSHFSMKKAA